MKKILLSVMAVAIGMVSFTSCEDVPEPYATPSNGGGEVVIDSTDYINETFASGFGSFKAVTPEGTAWTADSHGYAKGTGYDNTSKATTASNAFLVSKTVDLSKSTGAYIQMDYILRYYTNYGASKPGVADKLLITDNYTGDPTTTTWTDITGTLTEGSDWNTWTTLSVNVPAQFIGKNNVVVALQYTCQSNSATWEVKNFKMAEGKASSDTPVTPVTGDLINETFESGFGTFSVNNVKGTPWTIDFHTAKASGYDSGSKSTTASESYLVSKAVDLSSVNAAYLEFQYILRYYTTNGSVNSGVEDKVLITDNYTGDASTTHWTDITGTLTEGRDWTTFSTYKQAIPSAFIGKKNVVIALKYACDSKSATWEVKNLKLATGTADDGDDNNKGGETIDGDQISAEASALGLTDGTTNPEVTLSDGTKLAFAKGDGKSEPKVYVKTDTQIRVYANNTITVSASKKILKIEFICSSPYNATKYNGSDAAYVEVNGTKHTINKVSDTDVTFSGFSASEFVINNFTSESGGNQLRITKIIITYAK